MYKKIFNKIFKISKSTIISQFISFIIYILFGIMYFIKYIYSFKKNNKQNKEEAYKNISNLKPEIKYKKPYIRSNNTPKVDMDLSIIIPAYNVENYIVECIKSVIEQNTKYNYEVIVINDGSTDGTKEKLGKFIDYESIIIINQRNKGLSAARNKGLENATGKYIMFLDSDDILLNESINVLLDYSYENDADILEGELLQFTNNNEIYGKFVKKEDNFIIYSYKDNAEFIFKCTGYACGKIYKKQLWENIRFPEGFLFEDTIIRYLLVRNSKKYIYVPQNIYGYRKNLNSISHTFQQNNKGLDTFWIVKYIIDLAKSEHIKMDDMFYKITIDQLGRVLYERTRNMDEKNLISLLILSKEILESIEMYRPITLSFWQTKVESSIKNVNVARWIIASKMA